MPSRRHSSLPADRSAADPAPGDDRSLLRFLRHRYETAPNGMFGILAGRRGDVTVSVGDLVDSAARWAAAYAEAGIGDGDILLIFLGHSLEQQAAFVGAMMAGAVPSFMPPPSSKQDPALYWSSHRALFARIRPRVLVTTPALADTLAESLEAGGTRILTPPEIAAMPATAPRWAARRGPEIALLQHSSGTTRLKKGICLSHAAIERQLDAYGARLGLGPDDRIATWLPLYHDMGLVACFLQSLVRGVPFIALDPFEWVLAPWRLFEAIERFGATLAWMPNFAFHHLARTRAAARRHDLSRLRALIDCSEPCRPESFDLLLDGFADCGLRPAQLQVCYAMAETVFAASQTALGVPVRRLHVDGAALQRGIVEAVAADAPGARCLLSTGRPLDSVRVAIRDDAGAALAEGRVGEIQIAAPFLFDGYLGLPDETAERLADGVYATHDLGFLWDGELFVLGRADDVIVVNGRNLYAHELEFVATGAAGIKPGRLVALGVEDPGLGSRTVAILGETEAAGDEHPAIAGRIRSAIAQGFDVLVHDVALVPPGSIVKTTSGKISRRENLTRYLALRQRAPTGDTPS